MTLYKLYERMNKGDTRLLGVYYTKELAEARKNNPTKSSSLRKVNGEYHMVDDLYEYTISPLEWDKELVFDIYVSSPKGMYGTKGKRIADLSYDESIKLYEEYSKRNYVDLQLPQNQFGNMGITKIKSNRDDSYWKAQKAWEEEQAQDPMNYPENEPAWLR